MEPSKHGDYEADIELICRKLVIENTVQMLSYTYDMIVREMWTFFHLWKIMFLEGNSWE